MPSASVSSAVLANDGWRRRLRTAKRMSENICEVYTQLNLCLKDWRGSCSIQHEENLMRWISIAILSCALGSIACTNSPTSPSSTNGNFKLMLKDSPFSDAKAVLITFTELSTHRDGDGGFAPLG